MEITKEYDGKELTISVEGRIDTITSQDLEREIASEMGNFDSMVMDFTDLRYISSAGLRLMIVTHKKLKQNNVPFIIRNVNDTVGEIFRMTGFDKILAIEVNSITLKPELNELYALNEFISNVLHEENLQVNLIAEEIFVNIVNYSNADFITANAEYEKPTLTLEFVDNGMKFNPLMEGDYETPENIDEAEIGGLGIFLTKKMADELEYRYENGENHLTIIKNVRQ